MSEQKCRYCARILKVIPHTPVEIEPHCTQRGCVWCSECATGQTSVSPVRERVTGDASADYAEGE